MVADGRDVVIEIDLEQDSEVAGGRNAVVEAGLELGSEVAEKDSEDGVPPEVGYDTQQEQEEILELLQRLEIPQVGSKSKDLQVEK